MAVMMMSKKLPTSEDVARLAGVSRATVSAYINGTRYVSDKLSKRIQDAIELLNYTPDELARSLKMQSSKTIGLLVPVFSKFYLPMIRSINDMLHQRGYTMLIGSSEEDPMREREVLQVFVSKKVRGVLIAPCGHQNVRFIDHAQDRGITFVQLNRKIGQLDVDSVISNTEQAIYDAVKYMVKKHGKRRIILMGHNPGIVSDVDKLRGYERAVNELVLERIVMEHSGYEGVEEDLESLMDQSKIDGIICTTRTYMEMAYGVLKRRNINMPGQISIVGYGDPVWTTLVSPQLTVISEDRYVTGEKAVNLLFDRIEGGYGGPARNTVIDVNFVVRET